MDSGVPGTPPPDPGLLTALLRDVSRSFYLTMRILPGGVRVPISLGYLLARATDTVADAAGVDAGRRLEVLSALSEWICGNPGARPDFTPFLAEGAGVTGAERVLLGRVGEAVELLDLCDGFEQDRIREVLRIIISGQELDLRRFGMGALESGQVRSLRTAAELDDYTYRVAGCVGEFWTRLCRRAVFPDASLSEAQLLEEGVRFGKGLQLVNILRDLPRDLQAGRCYLPSEELEEVGLAPQDLLKPSSEPALRPVFDRWLARADAHLDAGWSYTTSLPRGCVRVRLACAWPILIGVRTTALLAGGAVLDPGRRIKVGRPEVRGILWSSLWRLAWPSAWDRLAEVHRSRGRPGRR